MKSFSNLQLVILIVFVSMSVFLTSCSTPPRSDDSQAAGTEPVRELVLQPSRTRTLEEVQAMTGMCLQCHGNTYEGLQAITANYIFQGEVVQPHAYLDMSLTNPHNTTKGIDCLLCHDEHDLPLPRSGQVRKADLTYCFNCHHTSEIISCGICHAGH